MPTMRERCLRCAADWTPDGCTVTYHRRLTGQAWCYANAILAPEPVTRRALYVYLHECAHIRLKHNHLLPIHVEEYQAEQWAHRTMRAAGIPVPRKETARARRYVAEKIQAALDNGAKHIHPQAAAFARRNR